MIMVYVTVREKTMDTSRRIPAEIYSRVVGYFRPVSQWNRGKKEEFRERKELAVNSCSSRQTTPSERKE